jgi:hypothetical protein
MAFKHLRQRTAWNVMHRRRWTVWRSNENHPLQCKGDDRLTGALEKIPPEMAPPAYTAMVYFNAETSNLEVIDYVGSNMRLQLV